MRDAGAERPTNPEDPSSLHDRALHVIDVHQGVVEDSEVERFRVKGQRGRIAAQLGAFMVGVAREPDQLGLRYHRYHVVSAGGSVSADPYFARCELQRFYLYRD